MAGLGGVIGTVLGYLGYQVGQRTDAANASGSLHAKVAKVNTYLDNNLDKKVSDIAVVSVQRGTIRTGVNASGNMSSYVTNVTIAAVDMVKAFVMCSAVTVLDKDWQGIIIRARLTTPTNLEIIVQTLGSAGSWDNAANVAWEVVEIK